MAILDLDSNVPVRNSSPELDVSSHDMSVRQIRVKMAESASHREQIDSLVSALLGSLASIVRLIWMTVLHPHVLLDPLVSTSSPEFSADVPSIRLVLSVISQ